MNEENYEYEEISLREIIDVILKRKKIWISSTVIAILLSIVYLVSMYSPEYSIDLYIKNINNINRVTSYSEELYEPFTNYELITFLKSDSLLESFNDSVNDIDYLLEDNKISVSTNDDDNSQIEVRIKVDSLENQEVITETYINGFEALLATQISEKVEKQADSLLISYENSLDYHYNSLEFYEKQRENSTLETDEYVMIQEFDGITYEIDGVDPITFTLENSILETNKAIDSINFKISEIEEGYEIFKEADNYFKLYNVNITDNSNSKIMYVAIFTVFGLFAGLVIAMFKEYWSKSEE